MNISTLVFKEIKRRKLNFFLGFLSVVFAVTTVIGALTMLQLHDLKTNEIIAAKEAETTERMARLEDDYRKIMKKMGYNLLILPEGQNISDLFANNYASKLMPESYVDSLAASHSVLIRHLLPSLQQKIEWPEQHRTIILIGIRGEVPFLHKDPKEPMMIAVPKGSMIMGSELHDKMGLKEGDEVRLLGRDFKVQKCNETRGNKDDITVWINLQEAQELLNKENQINAILALKCFCSGGGQEEVREEVRSALPGIQVIEKGGKVLVRAEARARAAREAEEAILAEKTQRNKLRNQLERFAAILVPLVLLSSTLWIIFLFISNVNERKSETGILRAVGVKERSIMLLFLLKALLIGIFGAVIGYLIGFGIGSVWGKLFSFTLFNLNMFLWILLCAPLLSMLAAYIPALMAARQDPANVLREE